MRKKVVLLVFGMLFFSFMIIMTFSAKNIYDQLLPNVVVVEPIYGEFMYESLLLDGATKVKDTEIGLAILKEVYDQGKIFCVLSQESKGKKITIAREIELEIGRENGTHYEVMTTHTPFSSVDTSLKLILNSNKEIMDGDEVYVTSDSIYLIDHQFQ